MGQELSKRDTILKYVKTYFLTSDASVDHVNRHEFYCTSSSLDMNFVSELSKTKSLFHINNLSTTASRNNQDVSSLMLGHFSQVQDVMNLVFSYYPPYSHVELNFRQIYKRTDFANLIECGLNLIQDLIPNLKFETKIYMHYKPRQVFDLIHLGNGYYEDEAEKLRRQKLNNETKNQCEDLWHFTIHSTSMDSTSMQLKNTHSNYLIVPIIAMYFLRDLIKESGGNVLHVASKHDVGVVTELVSAITLHKKPRSQNILDGVSRQHMYNNNSDSLVSLLSDETLLIKQLTSALKNISENHLEQIGKCFAVSFSAARPFKLLTRDLSIIFSQDFNNYIKEYSSTFGGELPSACAAEGGFGMPHDNGTSIARAFSTGYFDNRCDLRGYGSYHGRSNVAYWTSIATRELFSSYGIPTLGTNEQDYYYNEKNDVIKFWIDSDVNSRHDKIYHDKFSIFLPLPSHQVGVNTKYKKYHIVTLQFDYPIQLEAFKRRNNARLILPCLNNDEISILIPSTVNDGDELKKYIETWNIHYFNYLFDCETELLNSNFLSRTFKGTEKYKFLRNDCNTHYYFGLLAEHLSTLPNFPSSANIILYNQDIIVLGVVAPSITTWHVVESIINLTRQFQKCLSDFESLHVIDTTPISKYTSKKRSRSSSKDSDYKTRKKKKKVLNIDLQVELNGKGENDEVQYVQEILELCKKKIVPVLFVKTLPNSAIVETIRKRGVFIKTDMDFENEGTYGSFNLL